MRALDYSYGPRPGYVAFDVETASKDPFSVCPVGLAVIDGGRVVKRGSCLMRPPTPHFAYRCIHGIGANDLREKPAFHEFWPWLKQYFENRLVIAHNADFDVSVLRQALDAYGIAHPTLCYLCTQRLAKRLWPDLDSYGLGRIAIHLGVDFTHHDPVEAAFACAHIVLRGCEQLKVESIEDSAKQTGILLGRMSPECFEECRFIP